MNLPLTLKYNYKLYKSKKFFLIITIKVLLNIAPCTNFHILRLVQVFQSK
ncbi:hypothetical protein DRW57_01965 [Metamycoplasma hominis]|uniref:Uncharacterized protein n=1 Tax=Metamycoplasma hominis TaxID=2098 RepID=A0A454C9V4_METHO|nr:hypothetical protein KN71_002185 [Metamycoplasma hominis]RBI34898.1 hypothetical protein DRW57_01965 [Metamycoplasma hominis]